MPKIEISKNLKITQNRSKKITLSQYFEKELLEEALAAERMQEEEMPQNSDTLYEEAISDEDEEIYTSYASYMSSSDPGSNNLLVTFDYGFEDSLEANLSMDSQQLEHIDITDDFNKNLFQIAEEEEENAKDLSIVKQIGMHLRSPNIFKVHRVQHIQSNSIISGSASSHISLATSLNEYNIDTSGDYGSWAQSESEQDKEDCNATTYRNYRDEDLIKNEVLIYYDKDGKDTINGENGRPILINFNFDENLRPRWFIHNEQLYYKSLDFLN